MLKKTVGFMLACGLMLCAGTSVYAKDITVTIDEMPVVFDVPPMLIQDRTMVPVRAIFEGLGATVDWNEASQTVTAKREETMVKLTIDSPFMIVNDKSVLLDAESRVVNDRTLVPVRAISEAFGFTVNWDDLNQVVQISTEIPIVYDDINDMLIELADKMEKYDYNAVIADCETALSEKVLTGEDAETLKAYIAEAEQGKADFAALEPMDKLKGLACGFKDVDESDKNYSFKLDDNHAVYYDTDRRLIQVKVKRKYLEEGLEWSTLTIDRDGGCEVVMNGNTKIIEDDEEKFKDLFYNGVHYTVYQGGKSFDLSGVYAVDTTGRLIKIKSSLLHEEEDAAVLRVEEAWKSLERLVKEKGMDFSGQEWGIKYTEMPLENAVLENIKRSIQNAEYDAAIKRCDKILEEQTLNEEEQAKLHYLIQVAKRSKGEIPMPELDVEKLPPRQKLQTFITTFGEHEKDSVLYNFMLNGQYALQYDEKRDKITLTCTIFEDNQKKETFKDKEYPVGEKWQETITLAFYKDGKCTLAGEGTYDGGYTFSETETGHSTTQIGVKEWTLSGNFETQSKGQLTDIRWNFAMVMKDNVITRIRGALQGFDELMKTYDFQLEDLGVNYMQEIEIDFGV